MTSIEFVFKNLGASFITTASKLTKKLNEVEGLIFDWDGVFNSGIKSGEFTSTFSEVDSMGINMLRFAYWLKHKKIPYTAIISGQNSQTAVEFAKREHFNEIFCSFKDKKQTLPIIKNTAKLKAGKLCFVFDDIIDVTVAMKCHVSFLIRRKSNPLFVEFIKNNKYADYISANSGSENALREISELITGLLGLFDEVLKNRINFSDTYQNYFEERNKIITKIHIAKF